MFKQFLFEADKSTGTGETPDTPPAQQAATFTQADIDRIIKERLEQEKRTSDEKARKAAEKAAADAIKETGDFKTLSEKQAEKMLELETKLAQTDTLTQERDTYKQALEEHVKKRREGVPADILEILDVLDPLKQLAWLDKNANKHTTQVGGVPATPRAETPSAPNVADLIEQRRRTDSMYKSF
jgi:hypothetical protein